MKVEPERYGQRVIPFVGITLVTIQAHADDNVPVAAWPRSGTARVERTRSSAAPQLAGGLDLQARRA